MAHIAIDAVPHPEVFCVAIDVIAAPITAPPIINPRASCIILSNESDKLTTPKVLIRTWEFHPCTVLIKRIMKRNLYKEMVTTHIGFQKTVLAQKHTCI